MSSRLVAWITSDLVVGRPVLHRFIGWGGGMGHSPGAGALLVVVMAACTSDDMTVLIAGRTRRVRAVGGVRTTVEMTLWSVPP